MLFVVPGIIRQRAVSERGRCALPAVAVVSTGSTRADSHRGNSSRRGVAGWQCAVRVCGRAGRTDEWTDIGDER